MNEHFDTHFNKRIITIHPGEFFSSKEDLLIATVLGSCISIALFDYRAQFGGLNHFMLPELSSSSTGATGHEELGRYGNYAIELLINDMLAKGAQKKYLNAKVFGGGNVLPSSQQKTNNTTGINNITFALSYLETEGIPIMANDTGGIYPRKIYFDPKTFKVYVKRIKKTTLALDSLKKQEEQYKAQIKTTQKSSGDIVWF